MTQAQKTVRPLHVYYNDNDPYCCRVLRKNIERGYLPEGTIDERDIRDITAADLMGYQHIHLFAGIGGFPLGLKWANFPESVKILTGGFPCQDISTAGKQAGITGSRSGLWSEMSRLICELRPRYVIVENVSNLLNRGMGRVLGDLAACGYDAEWQIVSAKALGAPHLRKRVFIVAYARRERIYQRWQSENAQAESIKSRRMVKDGLSQGNEQQRTIMADSGSATTWLETYRSRGQERQSTNTSQSTLLRQEHGPISSKGIRTNGTDVSDPDRQGLEVGSCFGSHARTQLAAFKRSCSEGTGQWAIEPGLVRVADGIPHRVDRLRGLGNAVVPQVVEYIARCIMTSLQESEVA